MSVAATHIGPVTTSTGRTGRPSPSRPVPCRLRFGAPSRREASTERAAEASSASAPCGSTSSPSTYPVIDVNRTPDSASPASSSRSLAVQSQISTAKPRSCTWRIRSARGRSRRTISTQTASVKGLLGTATGWPTDEAATHSVSWPAPHADRGSPTSRPSRGSAAPPWTASCTAARGSARRPWPRSSGRSPSSSGSAARCRCPDGRCCSTWSCRLRSGSRPPRARHWRPSSPHCAPRCCAAGPSSASRATRRPPRQCSTGSPIAAPTASSSRRPTTPSSRPPSPGSRNAASRSSPS